jgi:hypothetical protein
MVFTHQVAKATDMVFVLSHRNVPLWSMSKAHIFQDLDTVFIGSPFSETRLTTEQCKPMCGRLKLSSQLGVN